MNSHDIANMVKTGGWPMHHPVRLSNEVRPARAPAAPAANAPRETTTDEHNAIWAALTMLANAMDGKPLKFADVEGIHTCDGEEPGLSADAVWNLRDCLDTGTITLTGFDDEESN